jgi:hypothetical protein
MRAALPPSCPSRRCRSCSSLRSAACCTRASPSASRPCSRRDWWRRWRDCAGAIGSRPTCRRCAPWATAGVGDARGQGERGDARGPGNRRDATAREAAAHLAAVTGGRRGGDGKRGRALRLPAADLAAAVARRAQEFLSRRRGT